jgi:hypothetical protein
MLQGEEDPETLYPLLISLGTLVPCPAQQHLPGGV